MKCFVLLCTSLFLGALASAQDNTIQMQCRNLASTGNVLDNNETLVNGMACHQVKQTPPKQTAVPYVPITPVSQPITAVPPNTNQTVQPRPMDARQCLILKRMGPADQITSHMYSFGVRGKQFQYVEGDFPTGAKFHGRLTDHDVRSIQGHGGKVVIMEPKYSADDLREAKLSCKEQ
jgi:hypothetical protein